MLNRYFHRLLHYINLSFTNYYLKDSTKQYIIPYICVVIDIHDYTLFIVTNIYSLINLFKDMNEKEMPDRETLKAENTKAQMRKGVLEMCILGIISGEELYTSDIINKLKENELVVVEGTVYPLLTRLKNGGLLEYTWRESTTGPPRKYYRVTQAGDELLIELLESWNQLVKVVSQTTNKQSRS